MLTYSLLAGLLFGLVLHADRARPQSRVRRHAHRQSGAWRFPDARRVPGVLAVHAVRHQSGARGGDRVRRFRDRRLAALLPAGAAAAARQGSGNAVVHPVLRPVAGDRSGHHHRFRHQRALDPRRSARPRASPRSKACSPGTRSRAARSSCSARPFPPRGWSAALPAAAPCCWSTFICTGRGSAI